MKNKKLYAFLLLLAINLSTIYAQEEIICRGKIVDANTNLPLQDVRIYEGETLITQSNSNGEFQLSLESSSKFLLKKSGYGWYVLRVKNDDIQQIEMVPSKPPGQPNNNDFYFDGQLVPASEVNDASNINPDEIRDFNVRVTGGKQSMYLYTK